MRRLFDDTQETGQVKRLFRSSWVSTLMEPKSKAEWEARRFVETWYEQYPDGPDKKDLCQRLRSHNDEQHLAAFFELYWYAFLHSLDYDVKVHLAADPDRESSPDFMASRRGTAGLYLECTTVVDEHHDIGERQRLDDLLNNLSDSDPQSVPLSVRVINVGEQQLRVREVRSFRRQRLQLLNAADENALATDQEHESPKWPYRSRDWHLIFTPIIVPADSTGEYGKFAIRGIRRSGPGDPWVALPKKRREKAGHYGEFDRPYLIAVNDIQQSSALGEMEVGHALYGAAALVGRKPVEIDLARYTRARDGGLWHGVRGPRNRHVSGVMFVSNLVPRNVLDRSPVLWVNPWGQHAIDSAAWRGPQMQLHGNRLHLTEGVHASELLRPQMV